MLQIYTVYFESNPSMHEMSVCKVHILKYANACAELIVDLTFFLRF